MTMLIECITSSIDPNTKEPENVGLSPQQTCDQTCN
jgi:hypothetical protein